jgi:hypothetical protein
MENETQPTIENPSSINNLDEILEQEVSKVLDNTDDNNDLPSAKFDEPEEEEATEEPKEVKKEVKKVKSKSDEEEIKLPVSLKKEEREFLAKQDKKVQEMVARRVAESDKKIQETTTELSKLNKEYEKSKKKIEVINEFKEDFQELDKLSRQVKSLYPDADIDIKKQLKGLIQAEKIARENPVNFIKAFAQNNNIDLAELVHSPDTAFDPAFHQTKLRQAEAKSEADYWRQKYEAEMNQLKQQQQVRQQEEYQNKIVNTIEQFKESKPAFEVQKIMVENEELLSNVIRGIVSSNPSVDKMEALNQGYQAVKALLYKDLQAKSNYNGFSNGLPNSRKNQQFKTVDDALMHNLREFGIL